MAMFPQSSCNKYTSHLGSGQNVLSYSFYIAVTLSNMSDEVVGEAHILRYLGLLPDILYNMTRVEGGGSACTTTSHRAMTS